MKSTYLWLFGFHFEATYGRDFKPFEKNSDHVLFWEDFNDLKEHNNINMVYFFYDI